MHEKISSVNDWNPIFNRVLALCDENRRAVYSLYNQIGKSRPDLYNHECMEAALTQFETGAVSHRIVMADGALEYEEAMAGAELIAGEG